MKSVDIEGYRNELSGISSSMGMMVDGILSEAYRMSDPNDRGDSERIIDLATGLQGLERWLKDLVNEDIVITPLDVSHCDDIAANEVLVRLRLVNDEGYDQEALEKAVHNMLTIFTGPGLKLENRDVKVFPLKKFEIISGREEKAC